MDLPNPKLFFPQKSLAEQNDIKKSSEHNKYFHWKKNAPFLKRINNILQRYKETSETIRTFGL